MSAPYLENALTESNDSDDPLHLEHSLNPPDFAAALIVAMTAVFMAMGFSIAFGLRPELGITGAVVVSIGYGSVLLNRRAKRAADQAECAAAVTAPPRRTSQMPITLHTPDTIYSPRHIPSWLALACAAGSVNGFAFLACEEFVSHITGTSTRAGLEWQHLGLAAEYMFVLGSFIAGAVTSVIWLQARACRGKLPQWATPLRAVALILAGAAVVGHTGYFGPFGGQLAGEPPFSLLSVLAFAMGLQNAAVASTTGLSVRTTHLTGPATDLGIHLGTAFFARGAERRDSLKGAGLRMGKIVAFVAGAVLAVPLTDRFGYLMLLAPASLVSCAVVLSFLPDWSPSDFLLRGQLADGPRSQNK